MLEPRRFQAPRPFVPLPARIAIFLSGRGSNFGAIAAKCEEGVIPASIALVVSDRANALGLQKARDLGLEAVAVERAAFANRSLHETEIERHLERRGVDVICLAGFMRILSPQFVEKFPFRILNIHPSLLPAFPGLDAQRQAIEYGARVSGVTVHFVDAGMDTGPVITQEALSLSPGIDTLALSEKLLAVEHRLYPIALKGVLAGGWEVLGRTVSLPG